MKNLVIAVSIALLCVEISAQELISSAGASFENTDLQVSWSIGEIVVQTISSDDLTITQGFQQPNIEVVGSEVYHPNQIAIELFPNPTSSVVNIKGVDIEVNDYYYELVDISGKVLVSKKILDSLTEIDLGSFQAATYYIVILKGKRKLNTFTIIKH